MSNIDLEALSRSLTELSSMIADDDDTTSILSKIDDVCDTLTNLRQELMSNIDTENIRYPESLGRYDRHIRKALDYIRERVRERTSGAYVDVLILYLLGFLPGRHPAANDDYSTLFSDNSQLINNRLNKDLTAYGELSAQGRRDLEEGIQAAYRRMLESLGTLKTQREFEEARSAYTSILAFVVTLYNLDLPYDRSDTPKLNLSSFLLGFREDA